VVRDPDGFSKENAVFEGSEVSREERDPLRLTGPVSSVLQGEILVSLPLQRASSKQKHSVLNTEE
jgi:hypothetical protein